jgi:hypothetical protein
VDHSQASEWISQRHDSATGTNEWAYVDLGSATDFNVPYIRWRTDKKYLPVHWKVETANSSSGPWSTQAEFDNSLEWKWPIAGPVRRTGRFCLPLRGEWQ